MTPQNQAVLIKPHNPADWGSDEIEKPLSKLQRACDELAREISMRQRCYPRWVEEGRMSRTESKERMFGLVTAQEYLKNLLDSESSIQS